jgi:PKD repeat protein
MDKRVVITVFSTVLLALVLLFVKVFHKGCTPVIIVFSPEHPLQGEFVKFKAVTKSNEELTWSFGDSSAFEVGKENIHKYDSAATYKVKVSTGEDCFSEKEITVATNRKMETVKLQFNYPTEIHVNEPAVFTDVTNEANTWIWEIEGFKGSEVGKTFIPTFKRVGKYTITLMVRGTYIQGDTSFEIMVKPEMQTYTPELAPTPKPVIPPVPAKVVPKASKYMTDADFETNFIFIANALASEDENAGNKWRDKIVSQAGAAHTMKVTIIDGSQQIERKLENFKQTQLVSSEPYKVLLVKNIVRSIKDGPITEITIMVIKK